MGGRERKIKGLMLFTIIFELLNYAFAFLQESNLNDICKYWGKVRRGGI